LGFDAGCQFAYPRRVDAATIKSALADISAEKDPTLKSIKLASLCSALWAERGVELVVVGGSAIEFLTEGAYASGDLDMCYTTVATLPIRDRQEVMGLLGAQGGPRNWKVVGMYFDLLGRRKVSLARLIAAYPQENSAARECARTLAGVAMRGQLEMNWAEVQRIAQRPEYRNIAECKALVDEVANELKIRSPFNPH